jgi:hypothetical protein
MTQTFIALRWELEYRLDAFRIGNKINGLLTRALNLAKNQLPRQFRRWSLSIYCFAVHFSSFKYFLSTIQIAGRMYYETVIVPDTKTYVITDIASLRNATFVNWMFEVNFLLRFPRIITSY